MATNDSTLEEDTRGVECPIASFVRGLKTFETRQCIVRDGATRSGTMIVAFNKKRLTDVCYSNSPDYNPSLCDFDLIASEIFKEDETWVNRGLVKEVMDLLAKLHGWVAKLTQKYLQCNRYGEDDTSRQYAAGALKCNCTFRITLSAWKKDRHKKEATSTKAAKWIYSDDWDAPVTIKDANCKHGGMCNPGKQNRIATAQRAGTYVQEMPNNTLYTLCNYAEQDGKLSTSTIKKVMARVWPTGKVITKNNVFHIRVKVMRCLKTYKETNGDYNEFKQLVNDSDFLSGIDSEVSIDDDEAYELAQSLWAEVMSDVEKDEVLFSFIDYLQLISARAKGFAYKLAYDESRIGHKKVVGVIWQTATMRRNFELFGDVVSLDMMKRGLNKLLWPYAGVAMYDEMRKLCIACEGVLCGERTDMYKFVANFLDESTPLRKLADVKIVAGDAFFSQELVKSLGFINAVLVLDRWHLLDSGLEKIFGKPAYEMLKGHLIGMVQSDSSEDFDSILSDAKKLLQSKERRDGSLETTLQKFADKRGNYANYCIRSIPGNRGLLGSASSEQNHSSALVFLNDGDKTKNTYCEHVITLIKDLLRREQWKTKKTNEMLFASNQRMLVERERLAQSVQTNIIMDLRKACDKLNESSYGRFKERRFRADKDLLRTEDTDPLTGESIVKVCSARYTDAPPRIFRSTTDRCSCPERLAEEDMCAHEIKAEGGFDVTFFKQCHMARESVTGSLEGWAEPLCNQIDGIIGYKEEIISPPATMNMPSPLAESEEGADTLLVGTVEDGITNQFESVAAPQIDLFPEKSGKCKPLQSKTVKNILSTVSDAYDHLDEDLKFQVSALSLQLQNLMTIDPEKSKTVTSRGGYSVTKPDQSLIASQVKTRLIPQHEQRAIKASEKLNTAIQNLGRKQVVTGKNGVEIEANGKTRVRNCQFCKEQHVYTNCSRRACLKMNATEYMLSESPQYALNQKLLRTYINHSMPHSLGERGTPFDNLDSKCISSNFIIHEACKDGHEMIYSVSFLNNQAQPDEKLWITSDAMNSVITHTKKKIKFVYVETIFSKPGWVPLQKGDCRAVGVSNDGAVGFRNDGNNGSSDNDDGSDDEKVDHSTVADSSKSAASKRKSRVSSIDFADEVQGEERMPKRAAAIEGQSYANAAIESRE